VKQEIPEEYWRAILENDSSYDGVFYYAVKTTGIFCRPSCHSRPPNKDNVRIYHDANVAQSFQYRPCKRCRPDGIDLPEEKWVNSIVGWLNLNYKKDITLTTLGESFHVSPYHLQRTFKRVRGVSPVEYLWKIRVEKAIYYLENTNETVSSIGSAVGYANTSYFVTLFKKEKLLSPTAYRKIYKQDKGVSL